MNGLRLTYVIIAICAFVFFVLEGSDALIPHLVLIPMDLLARPWTILTSMFAHADLEHIFFNMFALFMFGSILENRIGSGRFIFLYLMAGVLGSVGFMLLNSPDSSALGASGAIYGILGALMILMPNMSVYMYFIPIPMWLAGPIYALIEIFALGRVDSIAHSAHILGFFGGALLALRESQAWPPKPLMELWKAIAIPVVVSLIVAVIFGLLYSSFAGV